VQWDPERVMCPGAEAKQVLTRGLANVRSIQVGMRGGCWLVDPANVLRITDVTERFRGAVRALEAGDEAAAAKALWPEGPERQMEVPRSLRAVLEMDPPTRGNGRSGEEEEAEATETEAKEAKEAEATVAKAAEAMGGNEAGARAEGGAADAEPRRATRRSSRRQRLARRRS